MEEKYTSDYYIENLGLEPHPEGGYFKQTYLDEEKAFSSILFLIREGEVSHFHELKEDELWYFHGGNPLVIYEITTDGQLKKTLLGDKPKEGQSLQYLVKKGSIFGAAMENSGFSIVGCMVCPAFSYEHFKLYDREELLKKYPEHKDAIIKMTY